MSDNLQIQKAFFLFRKMEKKIFIAILFSFGEKKVLFSLFGGFPDKSIASLCFFFIFLFFLFFSEKKKENEQCQADPKGAKRLVETKKTKK
jgi:type III secretory pathway component EscV